MTRILIVEDEKVLSDNIRSYLHSKHVVCEVASDFDSALDKTSIYEYSCIILDLLLPGGHGLEILKGLRKANSSTGVLIISAENSIYDKVYSLNIGADDYLTKPFHLAELKARMEAIIRRKLFNGKREIVLDRLKINVEGRTLTGDRGKIDLTRKEYELLLYFIVNKNKVVTKEAIVQYLWGNEVEMVSNYDFIYTHVKNMRRKLMEAGCPDYIQAVYGMGYKFSVKEC